MQVKFYKNVSKENAAQGKNSNGVVVAEPYLTEFDSKSHQRAFYIKGLVNGYIEKTYTSGSVQNMDMQYNVAKTSDASFGFYEDGSA